MLAREYKDSFFETVMTLLWRHWVLLGIPGQVSANEEGMVLDPEALLLFSSEFARYDERLYDLILDWLEVHSSLINIQRLKALHAKSECKNTASLGYMAAVVAEKEPVRWAKPARDYANGQPAVPLFKDKDDKPECFIPKTDALAQTCGFLRNMRVDTGKIPPCIPKGTASLLLRMRGLFGISARAETLLILLNTIPCKVQDVVDRSGFVWKSIQDVLAEMKSTGFVASTSESKRGKQYYLIDPEKIKQLLGIDTCIFPCWWNIYDVLGELWQLISNPRFNLVSDETFFNEVRALYEKKLLGKLISSEYVSLPKRSMANILDMLPKCIAGNN